MQLPKLPNESQTAYIDRIQRAYQKALDQHNNFEASELYKQLIEERKKLNQNK